MVNKLTRKDKTKTKKKGFVYKGRDASSVKERAEQKGGRFDSYLKANADMFTPHQGENMIRIVPPTWEDTEHYGLPIWVHSRIGDDNSSYLCAKKMKGKACPICDAAREAKDEGEADEAKALTATNRFLYYVVDRKDKEAALKVWSVSWTMDRDIAALCHNPKTGKVLLIDHPDEGYDVSFRRTGQGINTRYPGLQIDRESTPMSDDDDEQAELLQEAEDNPLPSLLHYYDADYLEKILSGGTTKKDEELDEDEDDDDKPSKKKRKPAVEEEDEEEDEDEKPRRGKRKPVVEEEEDEEEEEKPAKKKTRVKAEPEEEEDEEEEEEKPSKRRRRAEPEDDDEEDDSSDSDGNGDDDEEEDEKPKKGRRGKKVVEEDGDEEEDEESGKDDDDEEEEEEKPKSRRGKKAAEPEDEEDDEEEKPRRGRRGRADPDEEEDDEDEDAKPAKKKTTRVKLKK
jgi:hypothetical protein